MKNLPSPRWLKYTCLIVFSVAIVVFSFYFGGAISGSSQLEIYKTLLSVAAIIFGVMGAWLSLYRADIISGIKSAQEYEEAREYVNLARKFTSPMTASAILIVMCLFYVFAYYSVSDTTFVQNYVEGFRIASFTLLCTLTAWQIYSLLLVMLSGSTFVIQVSRESKRLLADRKR